MPHFDYSLLKGGMKRSVGVTFADQHGFNIVAESQGSYDRSNEHYLTPPINRGSLSTRGMQGSHFYGMISDLYL
jgi:hypothetical protein